MSDTPRIVVLGGTGHFGARICRRLASEGDIALVVTSRDCLRARALVEQLAAGGARAQLRAAALDQFAESFRRDLRALAPDIVLHTAGPYQAQDYRVAKACIECGSHYIDLADGRDFVAGFRALNDDAERANVLLVSGASTLPALSGAVIDTLGERFDSIDRIEISIAPAHRTPRGAGTIAAVLSYCGKPFRVLDQGQWKTVHGWQDLRVQSYPSLGRRLSAACDVPDLALLPGYVPGVRTVSFHAALESTREQLALWLMAWCVRLRIVRDWSRCEPVFSWLSERLIRFGSTSGGMHVALSGRGLAGEPVTVTWYLVARRNHGPEIPCSPALVIARRLARNDIGRRGAIACLGLMRLEEFDNEVKELDISWRIVDSRS